MKEDYKGFDASGDELPPLPNEPYAAMLTHSGGYLDVFDSDQMQDYARAAVSAATKEASSKGSTKPTADLSALASCSPEEIAAFDAWAQGEKYDMTTHPLHWLFLNERTYAARQGWKNALEFARSLLATKPAAAPAVSTQQEAVSAAVARGWCSPENSHKKVDTDLAYAIVREVNAELSRWPRDVPEDYVLIPKSPTAKMIDATFNHPQERDGRIESHNARNKRIFAAMLAAAPASAGQAKSGIPKRAWSKEAEMMESWVKLDAGQAAPAAARNYRDEEFLTAARVALVALAHAAEKHGIYQTDHDRFAAAVEKFAAQPTERAAAPAEQPSAQVKP